MPEKTKQYEYLILGGGMSGAAAVEGLRKQDKQGAIGLFSAEPHTPYARPPLSKGLWKGESLDGIRKGVWRGADQPGVDLHTGIRVWELDPRNKRVSDLWNVWGRVEAARTLIAAPGSFDASNLRGAIR